MSNKVKTLLHICNYAAPYPGNFINSLQSLEKYEQIKNVYLFPPQANESRAKVWIDELNRDGTCAYIQESSRWKTYLLLKKIMKQHNVDKVVMHFSNLRIDCIVKFAVNKKKIIRFFHNPYRPRKKSVHLFRNFLWNGNTFVGVSNFVAERLRETFPNQYVCPVVNAIDFARLNQTEDFERNGKIVATIMGWDQRRKGLDLALSAIDKLRPRYDIILQIVAAANGESMNQFIFDSLGKSVDWAFVLPPRNDVATYFSGTDIFLSPSRDEAFGYAVVEDAYCEKSIVASRVDGQAELEIDGVYWFENENVDEMCSQIEKSIIELNAPEKIAQRAKVKEDIQHTYSLEKWSRKVADLL